MKKYNHILSMLTILASSAITIRGNYNLDALSWISKAAETKAIYEVSRAKFLEDNYGLILILSNILPKKWNPKIYWQSFLAHLTLEDIQDQITNIRRLMDDQKCIDDCISHAPLLILKRLCRRGKLEDLALLSYVIEMLNVLRQVAIELLNARNNARP